MGKLTSYLFCGLSIVACSQIPQKQKTFASPDGIFAFHYPGILKDCMSDQAADSSSCSDLVCGGPGSEGTTKACFAFPKKRFSEKPMFVAAAFFVSEIESAKTQDQCLRRSPNWLLIRSEDITKIHKIDFSTYQIGDNWASSGQSGPVYRNFHNRKCYELGIRTVIASAAYDPESHDNFTEQDRAEINSRLKEPLNSFVFLK